MDLSVVIVNWNSAKCLSRLIASLQPLVENLKEVVVVDNASEDHSADSVPGRAPFELFRLPCNRGFAAAANLGIERTTSKFVLLLNPDVEIVGESITLLYREIQNHTRAAVVCGPLLDCRGKEQVDFQIRRLPTFLSILSDVLLFDELLNLSRRILRRHSAAASKDIRSGRAVGIEQPAAAFWLLRKTAWKSIGGFDEQFYPAWFEDVDFCRRLRSSEWKILFFPACPIFHRGGHSLERLGYRRFVEIYYGNLLLYLRKHHRSWYFMLRYPVILGTWLRRYLIARIR